MTREDFEQLLRIARHLGPSLRMGILSPIRQGERKIFPKATAIPRWRWDLNKPGKRRFDLLLASNVFMYSPDPQRWFRHIFASCKYFLLLDLIRRRRGPSEFGTDGDCVRYAIGDARPRVETFYDLASLGERLIAFRTYYGGANEMDSDPLHFIALFRGDLADPVLRIDDYPTGIRPLLPNLTPFQRILEKVESRELSYHLGMVPALLTDEMFGFLRGLQYMIPTVHGYDHAYPRFAPLLQAKNDPYNQGTVGAFDEFKGMPYDWILERLRAGRRMLEKGLETQVEAYIPPGNRGNRRTGHALAEAGYRYYLSEKRIPGCSLPMIRSDFYGRSVDFDYSRSPEVTTLHCTWEWDVMRSKDKRALDRLLDYLVAQREEMHQLESQLGALVSQR